MARVFQGLLRHVQAGRLGAFQRHQLPPQHARVSLLARFVAPAAPRMLRRDNKVDCLLRGLAEDLVLRHAQRLAQDNRRLAVNVHAGLWACVSSQIAVRSLAVQQPAEAGRDDVLVVACQVSLAGPEERQQHQRRAACVTGDATRPTAAASAIGMAWETVQAPAAIGLLVQRHPTQAACHGRLGERGPAFTSDQLGAHTRIAQGQRAARRIALRRDLAFHCAAGSAEKGPPYPDPCAAARVPLGLRHRAHHLIPRWAIRGQRQIELRRLRRAPSLGRVAWPHITADGKRQPDVRRVDVLGERHQPQHR